MFSLPHWYTKLVIAVAVLLIGFPAWTQAQAATSTTPVTTVVTVLGPDYTAPPKIAKDDVSVYSNNTKFSVTSWQPATGEHAKLQLAILIDNAIPPTRLGLQLNDLKHFINSQPSATEVGLFYAQYGTVDVAADFSTNHEAVAKKLRLPMGIRGGGSPSIYLSLSSLISRWRATAPRREVLLIASGVDLLQPGLSDPYFDAAVKNAQKAGVVVNSIYAGSLRLGLSYFGLIAQGNLAQMTSRTGGDAFFQGASTPVAFAPYLNRLNTILHHQYLLTFTAPASTRATAELLPIKIRTEQRNIQLLYPHQVFVGK